MALANLEENQGAPERALESLKERLADRESADVAGHQGFDMLRRRADLPALEKLLAHHPHAP